MPLPDPHDDRTAYAPAAGAAAPGPGTVIAGRYRLDALIGRGGMGVVYRAFDLRLERDVAVKLLPAERLDADSRERLHREARAAATLNHPRVVAVYDVGGHEGIPFVVMELVDGTTLRARPPGSLEETVRTVTQIAEALAHAHDRGLVHRDLKPENVLLARDGSGVKLADLGLAVGGAVSRLTQEGVVAGTVAYMAPEQALGRDVDARTDLYALGVVLYELVTGRQPFTGDTPLAILSQHIQAPPVPPRSYRADLSPELDSFILRLLAKSPEQRFPTARETAQALAGLPLTSAGATGESAAIVLLDELARGKLIGRGDELSELRDLWRRAAEARAQLVLVSGEPGAGKTRLARELLVYAQLEGGLVLEGGCYEYESATPYLPFVEGIRRWVRAQDDEALRAAAGPVAAELSRLAPELGARLGPLPSLPPLSGHEERLRLFDGVARLLAALAERRPVVLFLDDLHWADQGTLALLHYLIRQLRDRRVLFLATYREIELDRSHPLAVALLDWNRERLSTRVALRRLEEKETGALLGALLDEPRVSTEFVRAIHGETEGNPFFIEEVVKALIEQGQIYRDRDRWQRRDIRDLEIPQSIKAAVGSRLNRVSETGNEALRAAALLGKVFDFDELRLVSNRGEDELLDALDEAAAAQLVVAEGSSLFRFTHDKIREVLVEEFNPVRRRRLHARIAEALEARAASGPAPVERLAHHFLEAGDNERAFRYSLRAAEEAGRVFAHEEALGCYAHARECAEAMGRAADVLAVTEAMGRTSFANGNVRRAETEYRRALELVTDPGKRAECRCSLGEVLSVAGDASGLEHVRAARAAVDPAKDPALAARATMLEARFLHLGGRHAEAVTVFREALDIAARVDNPGATAMILTYLAGALQHLARFGESNETARRVVELGRVSGMDIFVASGAEFLGENAGFQGYWNVAIESADLELEITRRLQARDRQAWSAFYRGAAMTGLGRLPEAETCFREAIELADLLGDKRLSLLLSAWLSLTLTDAAKLPEAAAIADAAMDVADGMGLPFMRTEARRARAAAHAAAGEWEPAVALSAEIAAILDGSDARLSLLANASVHASALVGLGRAAEALERIEPSLAQAREADAPFHLGRHLLARGRAHAALGRDAGARADLDAALAIAREIESRVLEAEILAARVDLRSAGGDAGGAAADAASARSLFAACRGA